MTVAEELRVVAPGVFAWRAYEPAVKCDLWSTAIYCADGWVVIDPIELGPAQLAELTAAARITAIILSNGNHERAADAFRQRHRAQIWAPRSAAVELGIAADHEFEEGEALPGGLRAVALPSAGPGEVAFLGGGALCFGDAVINLRETGLGLLPAKYCAAPHELANDVRKLLSYEFRILTFAHGDPIVHQAKERLQTLLA